MLATTVDNRERVTIGRRRESQIVEALKRQHSLAIKPANECQDKQQKIDCLIEMDGKQVPVQVKYRESGDDVLVEVFDRWNGWDGIGNKIGRDMQGKAEMYAVLTKDAKTVVMAPTAVIKDLVNGMVKAAQDHGWTVDLGVRKTLRYTIAGEQCQLKVQSDPADGRSKMVAYIPAKVLMDRQGKTYAVTMPKQW